MSFGSRPKRDPETFYRDFYLDSNFPKEFIFRAFEFIEKNFGRMSYLVPSDSLKNIEEYILPIDTDFDYLLTAIGGEVESESLSDQEFFSLFEGFETVEDAIALLAKAWLK